MVRVQSRDAFGVAIGTARHMFMPEQPAPMQPKEDERGGVGFPVRLSANRPPGRGQSCGDSRTFAHTTRKA